MAGALAYLDAMTVTGRTRLLLIEGPAVLGVDKMRLLDEANAERTLVQGLAAAIDEAAGSRRSERGAREPGPMPEGDVAARAVLLSAAFDRAALAVDQGADAQRYRAAMLALLEAVVDQATRAPPLARAARRSQ
jgi:hypothetical protein